MTGVWRFCPGECNPADLGSRGTSVSKLLSSNLWWHGPTWLINECEWPSFPICVPPPEVKVLATNADSVADTFIEQLCCRFSSLTKLIIGLAGAFRYIRNCKAAVQRISRVVDPITSEEKNESFSWLVQKIQKVHFRQEVELLQSNATAILKNSSVYALHPILDDTLLKATPRTGEPHKINNR